MIQFMIPPEFIPNVLSGEWARYGAILKDTNTGRIVGHLKEVGDLGQSLSTMVSPVDAISQVGQHYQLAQIQDTLNSLQMISTVGAVASVATLGVCVAGFIVVNNKLNKLNAKLDEILKEVNAVRELVDHLNIKWDALTYARLQTAGEQLYVAQNSDSMRKSLLESSYASFLELRNYYSNLIEKHNFWIDGQFPIKSAVEMYSRFIGCCLGQLQSAFLLGDLSAFRKTWEIVNQKVRVLSHFDKTAAFRARTDSISKSTFSMLNVNPHEVASQVKDAHAIAVETCARVETMIVEADYVARHQIDTFKYIKNLHEREPDILLLPAN